MVVGADVIHTAAAHDIETHEADMESDEEHLEHLFDSPTKPDSAETELTEKQSGGKRLDFSASEPADAEQNADGFEYAPDTPAEVPQLPTVTKIEIKRPVKRISPGNIKFTDYFGSQIVRNVKKPRREPPVRDDVESDDEFDTGLQLPLVQQPALDTRTLLLSADNTRGEERSERFLRSVLARSMAADDRSDVYITIDPRTGAVASQTVRPKHKKDTEAELFEKVPYPLDIDDWEKQVIWEDTDAETECNGVADAAQEKKPGQEKKTEQKQESLARDLVTMPKNKLLEDFETHIIWDSDTPFQSYSQLQINLNDTHMLFEDANVIKESNAREAERQRILEG
ncbi:hypothetical protein IW150_007609, partial [Coemansia sp. RSA 2607]